VGSAHIKNGRTMLIKSTQAFPEMPDFYKCLGNCFIPATAQAFLDKGIIFGK